jgi:hypothetical protein
VSALTAKEFYDFLVKPGYSMNWPAEINGLTSLSLVQKVSSLQHFPRIFLPQTNSTQAGQIIALRLSA